MPVSRVPGEAAAWMIGDLYAQAEIELVKRIAATVRRGSDPKAWDLAKYEHVQRLRRDAGRILTRLETAALAQAELILRGAYDQAARNALADLTGASFVRTTITPATGATLARILADLNATIRTMGPLILRESVDAYQQIIGQTAHLVNLGTHTRRQATQAALNQFANAGITGFVDKAGRNWRMDTYSEMATRTGAGNAAVYGSLDTYAANGQDLIVVSDAPRECPLCARWERQVLSIDGQYRGTVRVEHAINDGQMVTVTVAGTVEEAREAGLWHPNCRHIALSFLPGVTPTSSNTHVEHRPEYYKAAQQQRAMEREVRKWKRRAAVDDPAAAKKVRQWQARVRAHLDEYPDLKRLYYREKTPTGQKS